MNPDCLENSTMLDLTLAVAKNPNGLNLTYVCSLYEKEVDRYWCRWYKDRSAAVKVGSNIIKLY